MDDSKHTRAFVVPSGAGSLSEQLADSRPWLSGVPPARKLRNFPPKPDAGCRQYGWLPALGRARLSQSGFRSRMDRQRSARNDVINK